MTDPTCQRCGKSLWLHAELDYTGETDIAVCEGFMKEKEIELGHDGLILWKPFKEWAENHNWQLSQMSPNEIDEYYDLFKAGHNLPTAREARLVEALESTANASRQTLDIIKRENFVFDDLTDRWQKLAFTVYTELTQASTDAKNALAELRGEL
jgi:hypothetical protein